MYVCVRENTVDICMFPGERGVGEWASSGAFDWPTGTGARQDADWTDVWRLACRFQCVPCSFASQSAGQ